MAIEAPFHRKRLDLCYDFHFVDSTMAGNTTDSFVDMSTVVEVNKVGQVVNPLPQHRIIRFETNSNWLQESTVAADDSKITLAFGCSTATMTISASRSWRNRSMPRPFHCVMAVTAIHFELPSMKLVAKWHRLFWLMADVDNFWTDGREQTRCQISPDDDSRCRSKESKLVNPIREMKLLHSNHHARRWTSGEK